MDVNMEQKWYSVDECMPIMWQTRHKNMLTSYHEIVVRGVMESSQYNVELGISQDVLYYEYSIARLRTVFTEEGWIPEWDCQNTEFWYYNRTKITHWMDLGDSLVATKIDDFCEDE